MIALNILNDTQIRKARPENKEYKLSDGGGLSISVKPNGSKTWILNYINPAEHLKEQKKTQIIQSKTTFKKVFNEWLAIEAKKIAPKTLQTKRNRILNHFDTFLCKSQLRT